MDVSEDSNNKWLNDKLTYQKIILYESHGSVVQLLLFFQTKTRWGDL